VVSQSCVTVTVHRVEAQKLLNNQERAEAIVSFHQHSQFFMTASKSWSIALLVCCICLLLDRCFVTSFATTAMGYQQRTNERKVSMMSSYSDDVKVLVARAEMILIVPTSTVRTEYIAGEICFLDSASRQKSTS
jgi:hypothetical protein